MPTFICQTLFSQCIQQNVMDALNQKKCTENINDLCATVNPPKNPVGVSSSSASASATTMASTGTGSAAKATGSQVSTTSAEGLAAPTIGPVGNGVAAMAAMGMLAYLI